MVSIVNVSAFTNDAKLLLASGGAIWLTNVIAFGLGYGALDRGGPAARAGSASRPPALVFPEMKNEEFVGVGWSPRFVDYFHFSFATGNRIQPHRCFGHSAMDEADDDGGGGDFTGRSLAGRSPSSEHLEVSLCLS